MKEANSFIDVMSAVGHVFTIFSEAAWKLRLALWIDV
jgi:hypothetical protein